MNLTDKDIVTVLFMCQSPAIREQLISELQACFGDRIKAVNRIGQGKGRGKIKDWAFSIEVATPSLCGAEMLLVSPLNSVNN